MESKETYFIRYFLENCTFQVRSNNYLSAIFVFSNDTPQDSVISLTLFNIMVNDLNTVLTNSSLSQYADDSSVWSSLGNIRSAKMWSKDDPRHTLEWCHRWGFKLSETKTMAMIFTRRTIYKFRVTAVICFCKLDAVLYRLAAKQ